MPYPDTLPMPQTSTVTKGERRALSNDQQPREALPLQLDGMEFEELSWPPLDSSQMATLLGWWRTELLYGGAWFTATWPLPRGTVEAVRKFISPLRREFVPAANGGRWRVTATCEVRGEGVFPSTAVECDCSHIAWIMDPNSNVITDDELPALRGTMLVSSRPDLVTISDIDPLYGDSSIRVTTDEGTGAVITLIDPALSIVDAWTINFSVKADPSQTMVLGTWSTPDPGDPTGSQIRVELQSDGVGGAQFFFFDATTFNSGTQGGFSYDTVFNCEFSVGDGQFRFFVNGLIVFSQSSSASTFVRIAFQDMGNLQLDEIRVTDQVEHTSDYTIALPFCVCDEL